MFQKKGDIPTLKNIKLRSSVLVQVLIRPLSIEVEANKRRNLCLSLFVTSSRTPFTALQTVSSDMKVKQRQSNATHPSRSFNASSSIGLICFSLISQMVRLMSFAILPHWSMRSRKSSLFFIVSFEHGRPFNNVFLTMDKIYLDGKQDRRGCGQYRLPISRGTRSFTVLMAPITRVNEFKTSSLCPSVLPFMTRFFFGMTSGIVRE